MFNVLPNNLKKILAREYHVRMLIVAMALLLGVLLLCMVSILPSWLISGIKKQELESKVASLEELPKFSHTTEVSNTIQSTNKLLGAINTTFVYPTVVPYLNTVLVKKVSGVQIINFSYTTVDASHATISLGGTSATRSALVSYVKMLQDSGQFSKVDLPVSDLAKDTDISFVLHISIIEKP